MLPLLVVGRSLPFQRTTEPATKSGPTFGPITVNLLSTASTNCSPAGAQLGERALIVGTGLGLDPLPPPQAHSDSDINVARIRSCSVFILVALGVVGERPRAELFSHRAVVKETLMSRAFPWTAPVLTDVKAAAPRPRRIVPRVEARLNHPRLLNRSNVSPLACL